MRFLSMAIATGLWLAGSAGSGQAREQAMSDVDDKTGAQAPALVVDETLEQFPGTLRDADARSEPPEELATAPTRALSAAERDALLQRLPPLQAEAEDRQDFALRPASTPPPRSGSVQLNEFPSAAERQPPPQVQIDGPWRILRYAPEGTIESSARVSLSFDRPMVAIGSHADSVAGGVPAQLQPAVAGQWRWIGTRTLQFEPEAARLPMATGYSVQVDAGFAAADGSRGSGALYWQFSTGTVRRVAQYPAGNDVRVDTPILLAFDQRIDSQALLPFISLLADGKPLPAPRLLGLEQADLPAAVAESWRARDAARVLALRPTQPLPRDARITVRLAAGAPSAEGPLRSDSAQEFDFRTFGALQVIEHRCGWRDCTPADPFNFRFSNALAQDQDLAALVEIEPAAELNLQAHGSSLSISGWKAGLREYVVTLSPELRDVHGQQLQGQRRFVFKVGAMPPQLLLSGDGLVTVDPDGPPQFVFHSLNLAAVQLRVHRVQPADWPAWWASAELQWRDGQALPRQLPGQRVSEQRLALRASLEELAETRLDLRPWLGGEHGHLVLELKAIEALPGAQLPERAQPARALWLQVTDLGLDAVVDGSDLRAWVTALDNGRPLAGASLSLQPGGVSARSAADGLALLPLPAPPQASQRAGQWLEARLGDDHAFLPESPHYRGWGAWHRRPANDELRWYVFDDRQLYRPGEQVHLKGWLRVVELRRDGGLRLPQDRGRIRYTVRDSRGNSLLEGETQLAGLGGFTLDFELPTTPNLGHAQVDLELLGDSGMAEARHVHGFRIEEFRTPEFEVKASITSTKTQPGDTVQLEASANYYAGGALPGAPVNWELSATPTSYRPPGHDEWSFGLPVLWWRPLPDEEESVSASHKGLTGHDGRHRLALELDHYTLPRPLHLAVGVSVQDLNRQAWQAATSTLLHPASAYVGLRTDGYFVERGQPLQLQLLAVDIDGRPLPGRSLRVEAGRVEWSWRDGESREVLREAQHCELLSDADGRAGCSLATTRGGQYRITALIEDEHGRRNLTRILRWVSGATSVASDRVEVEPLQLIPDRDRYGPGDTARVLLQAPFADGHGLLTLGRHGVLSQHPFRMQGSSHLLEVPIRREWLPDVTLSVLLVGQTARDEADARSRPAQAAGELTLELSTAERRLDVALMPAASELAPGARTRLGVQVFDAGERPLADAEVALMVVDEAVLALGGYQLADPMDLFYALRGSGLSLHHLRPTLLLRGAEAAAPEGEELDAIQVSGARMTMSAPPPPPAPMAEAAMADAGGEAAGGAIALRSNFNPLAAFIPALRTDASGRAEAELTLPDNLTRYRVMAVAVAGATHYGIGEAAITARLPLMLRPSPPRFLNFGDRFEFPLLLQNQTDQPLDVQLVMQTSNLRLSAADGAAVTVPPRQRVELRLPMAAEQAGRARYQVAAATADFADAASGSLPVWTPATTEAFASYGVLDSGAMQQPIVMPGEVWPQFGGLSLSTSSTALASLTDAYLYLHEYPFQCSEQLASRLLATAALRDVLSAFDAPGMPTAEEVARRVDADLQLLLARMNSDGGFALWRQGQDSWPYVSVHATHALLQARDKGYAVDAAALQRALNHLRRIDRLIPAWYGEQARRHVIAYALHVRAAGGEVDQAQARALLDSTESLSELSFESLGWLLGVLAGDPAATQQVAAIRRHLDNRVEETAAGASFALAYSGARSDDDHLIMHSDRRADAVVLQALVQTDPDNDLIPKLVQALQAHRVRGRWGNTQENVFVLLALDRYFQRYESVTPDFVARSWLGQDGLAEQAFRGRSTTQQRVDVPMAWLAQAPQPLPLTLAREGEGRLYYRIGLDYAPRSLTLAPASHGFEVERRYVAIDDPADVRRDEEGRWLIRAGARVAVELTLVAPARRHHVALVDPLPAGLEALNPDLAAQGPVPPPVPLRRQGARPAPGWWWGPWYEHQNLRDERAEAFASLLPAGVYSYRYEARATTPGDFVVPPARAEEMYQPETFGRSGSDRVRVEQPGMQ